MPGIFSILCINLFFAELHNVIKEPLLKTFKCLDYVIIIIAYIHILLLRLISRIPATLSLHWHPRIQPLSLQSKWKSQGSKEVSFTYLLSNRTLWLVFGSQKTRSIDGRVSGGRERRGGRHSRLWQFILRAISLPQPLIVMLRASFLFAEDLLFLGASMVIAGLAAGVLLVHLSGGTAVPAVTTAVPAAAVRITPVVAPLPSHLFRFSAFEIIPNTKLEVRKIEGQPRDPKVEENLETLRGRGRPRDPLRPRATSRSFGTE
ncbi:prostaglandin G/H synthase 1 [Striga asiatica]|uniref:Prostaglandin G/H synthase 1 n=1 Tax=Striga asiatica TaxID=4170 RepID=A0A5A7PUM1_STRAF|nr:prostaglandin G/H synthase 1 [Striga asiatica]